MSKYGEVAVLAMKNTVIAKDPAVAWNTSAKEAFGEKIASIKKGCPRGAFLGLAEEGFLKGVPKGNYTNSELNKKYAVNAVNLLSKDNRFLQNKKLLWIESCNSTTKVQNGQIDVVLALWEQGYIKHAI